MYIVYIRNMNIEIDSFPQLVAVSEVLKDEDKRKR